MEEERREAASTPDAHTDQQAAQSAAEVLPAPDADVEIAAVSDTGQAQGEEELPPEQTPAAGQEMPDWAFGPDVGTVPQPCASKRGKTAFFAMFGAVFGICLVLLLLTFWLGDEGFRIIRDIRSERVVYVRQDDGSSGLLTPNEAADVVKKSTVTISVNALTGGGIGSGFVYDAAGHICTNYHVIESTIGVADATVQVILPTGEARDATLVGYDKAADIAVLRVSAEGLIPVTFGSSAQLLVGDAVVAVGTPAKLDYAGTSTFGTVSATNRLLALNDANGTVTKKMTVIQTDANVNPGNSGGPLADMYGHTVGMVVMKINTINNADFDGIGFALPIDGVRIIADAIIQNGSFSGQNPIAEGRSLLGISGHGGYRGYWYMLDPETQKVTASEHEQPGYHYFPENGVYVIGVNGGNAQSRIREGDLILRINGLYVSDVTDLIEEANRHYAGENVTLTVLRDGTQITVEVTLYEERAS